MPGGRRLSDNAPMRSIACLLPLLSFLLLVACGGDDRPSVSDGGTADASGLDAYIPPGIACDWPATLCDGVCVDTRTDVAHCGGCGRGCADGRRCAGGLCIAACEGPPEHDGIGTVASAPSRPEGDGVWFSAADVDRDGEVDLVMRAGSHLYLQQGAGDGTFGAPVRLATLEGASGTPTLVDLDGDSAPEVLIDGRDGVWVLPAVGDGTFGAPVLASHGAFHALGDFDGADGTDLLVRVSDGATGSFLGVALRQADGAFAAPVLSPLLPHFLSAVAGDFDGDGVLDAAYYEDDAARVGWLRGDGTGRLGAPTTVELETAHGDRLDWLDGPMACGRFTGGSRDEIAVALRDFGSWSPTEIFLLRVSSPSTLESVARYENSDRISWVRARDLDNDGVDELVAVSRNISGVIRFDGADGPSGRYFATKTGGGINDGSPQGDLADVDGDGLVELIAATQTSIVSEILVHTHLAHPPGGLSGMSVWFPAEAAQLAVADLDADGFDDVIAVGSDGVGTLFGGADTFMPGVVEPLTFGRLVAAGDLDADGDLDIVAGHTDGLTILRNGGGRTFEVDTVEAGSPRSITIVDINHDGHADLMDESGGRLGPAFVVEPTLPSGGPFLFGDLDGDGVVDAVGRFGTYLNAGDGTFEQVHAHPVEDGHTEGADEQALGDVDGDGPLDLVVGWGDGRVHVARGVGDGSFEAPVSVDVGEARDPALGDWDGDGADEIFVLHPEGSSGAGRIEVLGWNAGAIQSIATIEVSDEASDVRIGDFDGDGVVDLVVGHGWGAHDPIPAVAVATGRCAI